MKCEITALLAPLTLWSSCPQRFWQTCWAVCLVVLVSIRNLDTLGLLLPCGSEKLWKFLRVAYEAITPSFGQWSRFSLLAFSVPYSLVPILCCLGFCFCSYFFPLPPVVVFFFLFVIKADDCVACLFFLTTAQWNAGEWDCARKRMGCFHCGEGLVKGNFENENEDDRNVKISLNLAAYSSGYFSIMPVLCRVEECLQLGAVPWHLKYLYSSRACAWKPKRGNALGHRSTIISLARLWPWSVVPFWPGPASTSQTALRAGPGACAGPALLSVPLAGGCCVLGAANLIMWMWAIVCCLVSRPRLPTLLNLLE